MMKCNFDIISDSVPGTYDWVYAPRFLKRVDSKTNSIFLLHKVQNIYQMSIVVRLNIWCLKEKNTIKSDIFSFHLINK